MLTKSLSLLSANDQLSIIRVCQRLREHVVDTPGLWTHVDQIRNPAALSFVLERANNLAVDITNLAVGDQNDVRFEAVATHMHHIRTLGLHLSLSDYLFAAPSRAHTAFTATAPVLQLLSFRGHRNFESGLRPCVNSLFSIFAHTMPRLSSLQLQGVEMSRTMIWPIQSLRTLSFSFRERSQYGGFSLEQSASQHLRNLTTINVELAGWNAVQGYPYLGPSIKQINIRWTRPGLFVPRDTFPNEKDWNSIQAIHVKHMCSSSSSPPAVIPPLSTFAIPETTAPYQTLTIRTSGAPHTPLHARATDLEDRERVFCGLHPATVAGLVAQIPGQELSTITVAATAIALQVLSDAQCPALSCMRLVLDTDDISWINRFARDMPNITTLERLEFSQAVDQATAKWTTVVILRTLSSCIAAGNTLQEVLFLGFSPDAQCLAMAEMFSQQVVVDQDWREPKSDRTWFTELPFEWH